MRTEKEKRSFLVLRANGWSLTRIAKKLNIPKTTLWDWELKNCDVIYMFKFLQLEKLQDEYMPSYEDELKQISGHLTRVETALAQQNFGDMRPEFLLQMSLQLRARLDKMRHDAPLPTPQIDAPLKDLGVSACVTRSEDFPGDGEFADSRGADNPACRDSVGVESKTSGQGALAISPKTPQPLAVANHAPACQAYGHSHGHPHSPFLGGECRSAEGTPESANQNRTFPDQNGGGSISGPSAPTT